MRKGFTLIELLIVVAIIAILAAIAVPNFLEAQTRAKVSRVRSDQRTLATALESYYIDCNSYPAQASSVKAAPNGLYGVNDATLAAVDSTILNMPVFRRKRDANDGLFTLTTPVAYITSILSDPFADTKGAAFSYSVGNPASSWIVWSFGPNADETNNGLAGKPRPGGTDPLTLPTNLAPNKFGGDIFCFFAGATPAVDTNYYNPSIRNPNAFLNNSTYDPTNGTVSQGDVYRLKE